MKLMIFLLALVLNLSAADVAGNWKALFTGSLNERPKPFNQVLLDLKLDGNKLTGMAHMGNWPGDAPITDGKVEGNRITFTATGRRPSSSGIPRFRFEATVMGNEMDLTLISLHRLDDGKEVDGMKFAMKGKRMPD